jgi:hypothetical protein
VIEHDLALGVGERLVGVDGVGDVLGELRVLGLEGRGRVDAVERGDSDERKRFA